MDHFDLVVVGAGPAGYVGAIRAAQLGMQVAVVEKYPRLGGTCLNVGCIPSKALLDSSELYWEARHGFARHGIKADGLSVDLAAMHARKDKVVRSLTSGVAGLFKKNKIVPVTGAARLAGASQVQVTGDGAERALEAKHVLIATGSEPIALPSLPFDGERVISSTEALALTRVPGRLLVVGAGAIGLELGSVWNRLGAKVTVVEFLDRIVPTADRAMAAQLQRALERQGIAFKLGTTAKAVEKSGAGLAVTLESSGQTSVEETDLVLVAVGRRPHTEGLGARELGVAFDERGRIVVDPHYRTNVPGVLAVGDVIAGPMLAHKAMDEAVAAVERLAGQAGHVNYDAVPNVVYTWPELASVGISEEDAKARGVAVRVGSFPFMANGRAKCMDSTEGGVKVIADARTDQVLGVHILGPRASDMIAEAAIVVEFGGSAEDVGRAVHAHPTLPEAVKQAALAVAGRATEI
jgi:dihydrolipoamide dehydrogenase